MYNMYFEEILFSKIMIISELGAVKQENFIFRFHNTMLEILT